MSGSPRSPRFVIASPAGGCNAVRPRLGAWQTGQQYSDPFVSPNVPHSMLWSISAPRCRSSRVGSPDARRAARTRPATWGAAAHPAACRCRVYGSSFGIKTRAGTAPRSSRRAAPAASCRDGPKPAVALFWRPPPLARLASPSWGSRTPWSKRGALEPGSFARDGGGASTSPGGEGALVWVSLGPTLTDACSCDRHREESRGRSIRSLRPTKGGQPSSSDTPSRSLKRGADRYRDPLSPPSVSGMLPPRRSAGTGAGPAGQHSPAGHGAQPVDVRENCWPTGFYEARSPLPRQQSGEHERAEPPLLHEAWRPWRSDRSGFTLAPPAPNIEALNPSRRRAGPPREQQKRRAPPSREEPDVFSFEKECAFI